MENVCLKSKGDAKRQVGGEEEKVIILFPTTTPLPLPRPRSLTPANPLSFVTQDTSR